MLKEFPELLTLPSHKQPRKPSHGVYHTIDTRGPPIHSRPRRLSPEKEEIVKREFDFMLKLGLCRPSKSPWASPLHLVPKKNGDWRPCGDYRRLNSVTTPDRYPIPYLHDCVQFFHGKKFFTTLDLNRAYQQIPVAEDDIQKTAIITPFGLFEFPWMPFGLCSAAQTFQRFMDQVLRGLPFCKDFLDDIIIASETEEEHRAHLRAVLQRLSEFSVTINPSKCVFGASEVTFLGHKISAQGVAPSPDKVKAVEEYPEPSDIRGLKRFLGMVNFYHRFVPRIADVQRPLIEAVKPYKKGKCTPLVWTSEMRSAFQQLKSKLAEATSLVFPDRCAPLSLHTDASDTAIGAVLQQSIKGIWKPLAFFSRKLNSAQSRYSTYDRELLAIYAAIRHFRHWLEGNVFHVITDHKPLTFAFSQKSDKASKRQCQQLSYIAEFTTDIRYVSGENNVVPDALSRMDTDVYVDMDNISDTNALAVPVYITTDELTSEQLLDEELQEEIRSPKSSLNLKKIRLADTHQDLYCDCSRTHIRPYVPLSLRKKVFNMVHGLSHPSGKATCKQIAQKFVWPNMRQDINSWAKTCLSCQASKISRHNYLTPSKFLLPDDRFDQVHLDLVGPLPISRGYRYCLTMIDRFTRWPEAVPLTDITAEEVIKAFVNTWVSRFGAPKIITTDRGSQFESALFRALTDLIGANKTRTTAYHPQSNGMVERWHRALKASIMCHDTSEWVDVLPFVLLGLRTCFKQDLNASTAEFVYGKVLRVPGEFFDTANMPVDPKPFVEPLRRYMRKLQPVPAAHHQRNKNAFIFKDLTTCTHVFLRDDSVKRPLEAPYSGPHKVLRRISVQVFEILLKGAPSTVSVDRLKPAHLPPSYVEETDPQVGPQVNGETPPFAGSSGSSGTGYYNDVNPQVKGETPPFAGSSGSGGVGDYNYSDRRTQGNNSNSEPNCDAQKRPSSLKTYLGPKSKRKVTLNEQPQYASTALV